MKLFNVLILPPLQFINKFLYHSFARTATRTTTRPILYKTCSGQTKSAAASFKTFSLFLSRRTTTSKSIRFCLAFFRVLSKVCLRGKAVSTATTDVRPLFRMNTFMDSQIIRAKKPLLTNVTAVRFLATVRKKMAIQACFQCEPRVTNRARVQPLLRVSSLVPCKRDLPLETSTAVTANVRLP